MKTKTNITAKIALLTVAFLYILTANITPLFASGIGDIASAVQRIEVKENETNKKYADAVQIIFRNASCFETKNLDAYMDTLSPDCNGREKIRELSRHLMDTNLVLTIDITRFEILPGGTDKLVRIRCSQLTKKVGGATRFVDNELRAIHTVVKTEDGWKICETKILSIDMLHDDEDDTIDHP